MRAQFWSWCRYLCDAIAFRLMVYRRFRSWRERPREAARYRQRMEQWAQRNRYQRIGHAKPVKDTRGDLQSL